MEPTKIVIEEGIKKKYFRCKICLNEYKRKYIKYHIRHTHSQHVINDLVDQGNNLSGQNNEIVEVNIDESDQEDNIDESIV